MSDPLSGEYNVEDLVAPPTGGPVVGDTAEEMNSAKFWGEFINGVRIA